MNKTDIFFEALVKNAFSVTREGHAYDAAKADIEERAAAEKMRLMYEHGSTESSWKGAGKRFRGFFDPSVHLMRHHAYVSKKHKAGKNAYNPYGGLFTPSKYEVNGTKSRYGEIDTKRKK